MRSGSLVGRLLGIPCLLLAASCDTGETEPKAGEEAATAEAPAAAASDDPVARGGYLVNFGGCNDCHTPKLMTANGPVPDTTRRLSGHPADSRVPSIPPGVLSPNGWGALTVPGLTAWAGPWGVSFAANLTPDPTGLGTWTEEQFIQTMRTGKHLGVGRPILPPMPWYELANLTDEDLRAVFSYLRSLKPISNAVPAPIPPATVTAAR